MLGRILNDSLWEIRTSPEGLANRVQTRGGAHPPGEFLYNNHGQHYLSHHYWCYIIIKYVCVCVCLGVCVCMWIDGWKKILTNPIVEYFYLEIKLNLLSKLCGHLFYCRLIFLIDIMMSKFVVYLYFLSMFVECFK